MKTPEDEAFDELARKQGAWGGGFPAKRRMAADKFIAAEESKVGERYGYVPKLHPSEWMDAQPVQEPASYLHAVLGAFGPDEGISLDQIAWSKLHAALKAVLAQPVQEPVARVSGVYGGRFTYDPINRAAILPIGMALYAAPPAQEKNT
jgi:hypothetical protein